MKDEELWIKRMKEKLSDYTEPIPASGWERLEKDLTPPVQKKLIPYGRWMTAAAAVLLAVVTSVTWYIVGLPVVEEIREVQVPVWTDGGASSLAQLHSQDNRAVATNSAAVGQSAASESRLAEVEGQTGLLEGQQNLQEVQPNVVEEQLYVSEEQQSASKEQQHASEEQTVGEKEQSIGEDAQKKPLPSTQKVRRPSDKDKYHLLAEGPRASRKKWSYGLSVGNASGSTAQTASPAYMSRVSMLSVSNGLMEIPADQTLVFEDGIPYLRMKNRVLDMKHHQPITFGLSVRRELAKGFSVETGITYTLLSSDVRMEGKNQHMEQKLHYIGIPLRANWDFYNRKWFTGYVSGGGSIEKCVYGKLGADKQVVKPLQFSVTGAVGAQVNASKHVGIYLEPGVAYFFKDGSDVQTIRKDNPFQFTVHAGIRFTY